MDEWVDKIGGLLWYDFLGQRPSVVTDEEVGSPCIRSDGLGGTAGANLRLDAGGLEGSTENRSWAFVSRKAGISGSTLYLLRATSSAAESVCAIANEGREYNVGMLHSSGGFLPFDNRPSHTREICTEVFTKEGLVWRYLRNGVLLAEQTAPAHGNVATSSWQLFSNNGSNAFAVDLFDLFFVPGVALSVSQCAQFHQWAAGQYGTIPSSGLFGGSVTLVGDSFTSAAVVDNGRGHSVNTTAYREALRGRCPGVALVGSIDNSSSWPHEGVGGDTLDLMLARIAAALAKNQAQKVVLLGGVNDASGGESGADMLLDMKALAAAAFAEHQEAEFYIVDQPPNSNSLIHDRLQAFNAGLDGMLDDLRTENPGIDVSRIYAGSLMVLATHISGDGTHPNEAGYRLLANAVFDALAFPHASLDAAVGSDDATNNGPTSWGSIANAEGLPDGSSATSAGAATARDYIADFTFPAGSGDGDLLHLLLRVYLSVTGSSGSDSTITISYDVGSGFVELASLDGNLSHLTNPMSYALPVDTWSAHDGITIRVRHQIAGLAVGVAGALDAVTLQASHT